MMRAYEMIERVMQVDGSYPDEERRQMIDLAKAMALLEIATGLADLADAVRGSGADGWRE